MPQLVRPKQTQGSLVTLLPQWQDVTLIFRQESGRVLAIDGQRYGPLAIHESLDGSPTYSVTHCRSKKRLCRVSDSQEAIAKCAWLWVQCPRAWDDDEVRIELLSQSVVEYCLGNR